MIGLLGGGGNDSLIGNEGNNILEGGSGDNYFYTGSGNDTFVASNSGYDRLFYSASVAGVVVNLDMNDHSFVNSLGNTITVLAYSGGSKAVSSVDSNSYSIGDYYTPVSGTWTSFDDVRGSHNGDIIFGGTGSASYYLGNGSDYFYGGSGNELVSYSAGNDMLDGGAGSDVLYSHSPYWGSPNAIFYLDGYADTNNNSIADYIDRGVGSLVSNGVTYTGFAISRGTTLLINLENLLGESPNDYLVGDNFDNIINGRTGNNYLFGQGGNDTIHAAMGSNVIDGGFGTDTVDFSNSWYGTGTTTSAYVFLADANFFGSSDKTYFWGGNFDFQARTGLSTFSNITNVENITGSSLNDVLYGNSSANTITANNGDDIIAGNGGADMLYGGNGNDLFYATSAQFTTVGIIDGGANTDTIKVAGYNMTAGSLNGALYQSIEALDIRNGSGGGSYSMNANDIRGLADNGNSSNVTLKLDSGDTFTISVGAGTGALSYVVASTTATDTIYYLYSDAGHSLPDATNRVAILDVYTGTA